jgi:hypothetical protein
MGSLILVPSHSKMERYEAELHKKSSAVDVLLDSISTSSNSKMEEAAKCLMKVCYKKFEESFASVAIEIILIQILILLNSSLIDSKLSTLVILIIWAEA